MIGHKNDNGKDRWDLLPPVAMRDVVAVLTTGAESYGDNNWRLVQAWRYRAALGRHLSAYDRGQWLDPDSGLPHLAHVVCNSLFLAELPTKPVEAMMTDQKPQTEAADQRANEPLEDMRRKLEEWLKHGDIEQRLADKSVEESDAHPDV